MRVNLVVKFVLIACWILSACTPQLDSTPIIITATSSTEIERTNTPIPTPTPTIIPTQVVSTIDVTLEQLADTEVEFWHPWIFETESALLSLVEQFNKENSWGISVSAQSYSGDLGWSIQDGIPSNELPNLTVGYSSQIRDWDRRGDRIVDLNSYIDDPIWGLSPAEQADFYAVFWKDDLAGAKRLGLPVYRSAMMLFYNQSWAQELGFAAPPTTPAEFREQVCAPVADNPDQTAGWLTNLDSTTALNLLYAFGSEVVVDDVYHFATRQSEDAIVFIDDLIANACAWRPESPDIYQAFAARQGLIISSSLTELQAQVSAFSDVGNIDQWVVVPFPPINGQPVLTTYGLSQVIFQGTPAEQLASWLFIRWMNQPQQQSVWLSTTGSFSTRASTLQLMSDFSQDLPQWGQAQEMIAYSRSEPSFRSWYIARWAVQDAFNQLLQPDFLAGQIPDLLQELDAVLSEINSRNL